MYGIWVPLMGLKMNPASRLSDTGTSCIGQTGPTYAFPRIRTEQIVLKAPHIATTARMPWVFRITGNQSGKFGAGSEDWHTWVGQVQRGAYALD